jgi:hypothetical protein
MATLDTTTTADQGPENLNHVLETARLALDHEFQRAERLDARARGQATLAGTAVLVAQGAAAVAISADSDVAWALAFPLIGAVVTFFVLLRQTAKVSELRWTEDISEETLAAMEEDAESPDFAKKMVEQYRYILSGAQDANDQASRSTRHGTRLPH